MAKATEEKKVIYIKPIEEGVLTLRIVGDTPLIISAWTEKARQEMLEAQTIEKKTKKQKVAKNIWGEYAERLYWMDGKPEIDYSEWTADLFEKYATGARFGFPASAIKQAAISAAIRGGFIKYKTEVQGDFWILGEGDRQLVEITHDELPVMREDNVRLAGIGRVADLRYRPAFNEWSSTLVIKYDKHGNIDEDSIANMINLGGHKVGIGEWRVEKSGQYGMFHIETL